MDRFGENSPFSETVRETYLSIDAATVVVGGNNVTGWLDDDNI